MEANNTSNNLKDREASVAGASRKIGRAMALSLRGKRGTFFSYQRCRLYRNPGKNREAGIGIKRTDFFLLSSR